MTSKNVDAPKLEALFDSIVTETVAAHYTETGETPPSSGATTLPTDVFAHVGRLTRQLHETLRELGHDRKLAEVAESIPDTRDRLSYVVRLTEDAANKVLAATERAQPLQESVISGAEVLTARWDTVLGGGSDPAGFHALAEDTRSYLLATRTAAVATRDELLCIMMAQDFQDLTGQVMKRMTELTADLEQQLLSILIEHAPHEDPAASKGLQGPAFNARTATESIGSQGEVDALLESLGF